MMTAKPGLIHGQSQGLLEKGSWKPLIVAEDKISERDGPSDKKGRVLACSTCRHPITSEDQRIEMNGSHRHAFANPHGIVYHIGCFRNAPGCYTDSEETTHFTWFSGYSWSLASCSRCGYHLGWRFSSDRDSFYGLVVDRLVEKEDFKK